MSQTYEELTGGHGAASNYRAERYAPRALFRREPSQLEVDGHAVDMRDVSATGLCYETRADEAPALGGEIGYRLTLAGREAAHGRGAVVRVDAARDATRVGVRFLDRLVRPDVLRALAHEVEFGDAVARGSACYDAVPRDYRTACSDVQIFLAHWQSLLDRRERELRADGAGPDAFAEVEARAIERMRDEWAPRRERVGTAADAIGQGDPAYEPARQLAGLLFSPFAARSPLMSRCRLKPRGYPGDFVAMSWMYEGRRQGDSVFGRALDQLGLEERLVRTVPTRRDALLVELRRCRRRASLDRAPLRILNLGAGPARELHEWLDETEPATDGPPIELVIVDQDEQALAFAHDRIAAAALRHHGRVRVISRHLSFRQLFAERGQLAVYAGCALVYSAGLFDYLREPVARALAAACFELLAPGGRLLIGNAGVIPAARWMPEHVLDWKMVYRTAGEMKALGTSLGARAHVELGADASGTWHLLAIDRVE